MGAFQTGFGMGMQAWDSAEAAKERKLARERQDRMDRVALDAAAQQAELNTIKLDDLKQERTVRDAVRLAGTEMKGVEGFASGAAGQQIFSADKGVAQATADINSAAAELEADPVPGATPANGELRAATGVTGGGKPAIAGPGLKFDNSPEGRMKRQAAALRDKGYGEDAQKLETEFATNQSKLYDANRNLLFNNFMSTLQSGGADAAIKLYDHYNDGFTAVHDPNGAGGVVVKKDKDGKEVGRLTYKDRDDLALQVKRLIFPDQYLASKEKAASETVTVKPGEEIYQGGVLRYKNSTPTSGEASWARALAGFGGAGGSGSGGAGSSRGTKPEPALSERVTEILSAASKDADSAMRLSPDQLVQARSYGSMIARLNPEIDADVAANVAMMVTRNPELVVPSVGNNGRIMGVYVGQDGSKIPVGNVDVRRLSPEQRAALRPRAEQFVAEVGGSDPVEMDLVRRMAHGDKAAEQQLRAGFIAEQSRVLREQNPRLSALQINEVAGKLYTQQMQQHAGKLQAIGLLTDPPKNRPAPRQEPPVQPPGQSTGPERVKEPSSFSLSGDLRSPDSREAIAARLSMASNGGTPLSPRERLLARQFGLIN